MGAGVDSAPAEAEVVGRIMRVEFFLAAVDPEIDIMFILRGARGCTRDEGNSRGGGRVT